MTAGGVALGFFCLVGVAATGAFAVFFVEAASERRKREAWARAELERFARRPKARIVSIGTVVRDGVGGEYPYGFTLDCENRVPPFGRGPDGQCLCGNWTNAELVEIAKRRKEFE